MNKTILAAMLCVSTTAMADGQFFSGNDIYREMQRHTVDSDAFVMGYVGGSHDAMRAFKFYCSPRNATLGQMVDVVRIYVAAHPENRHLDADVIVSAALREVWPCPKEQKPTGTAPQPQSGSL